jgi:hypothetical protein
VTRSDHITIEYQHTIKSKLTQSVKLCVTASFPSTGAGDENQAERDARAGMSRVVTGESEDLRSLAHFQLRGLTAEVWRNAAHGFARPCSARRNVNDNGECAQMENFSGFEKVLLAAAAPPEPPVPDQIPVRRPSFPGLANCRTTKIAGRNRPQSTSLLAPAAGLEYRKTK